MCVRQRDVIPIDPVIYRGTAPAQTYRCTRYQICASLCRHPWLSTMWSLR